MGAILFAKFSYFIQSLIGDYLMLDFLGKYQEGTNKLNDDKSIK